MAISLNAEQKSIKEIFNGDEQYIVPSYQRPYSWGFEECSQLYTDLMDAFLKEDEYFLGNIILAKSKKDKKVFHIIDGQQRCISLWIVLKVMYILHPEIARLQGLTSIKSWTDENTWTPKIKSYIYESNDDTMLVAIHNLNLDDIRERLLVVQRRNGEINENKVESNLELIFLYFFQMFSKFKEQDTDKSRKFVLHLIENIYLLPIELLGDTIESAVSQALSIFETINNRGKDLEDADIFKATLYSKALQESEQDSFIESWAEMRKRCDAINMKIDDIFRYYSHIIRGKQGVVSSEKGLRVFFTEDSLSPLKINSYKVVVKDLQAIIEAIEYYTYELNNDEEIAKWLQIIEAYTNAYPKYALITYLYINGVDNNQLIIDFLKSLIRYVYYRGSTTAVKFEIYTIIYKIVQQKEIDSYACEELPDDFFNSVGRLQKGLSLLAYYNKVDKPVPYYNIDKFITSKFEYLDEPEWLDYNFDELGNIFISDIPAKNCSLKEKANYLSKSNINSELISLHIFDFPNEIKKFIEERTQNIKVSITSFFTNSI